MMIDFESYLAGGDLRSVGKVDELVPLIDDSEQFDALFDYLHSEDCCGCGQLTLLRR